MDSQLEAILEDLALSFASGPAMMRPLDRRHGGPEAGTVRARRVFDNRLAQGVGRADWAGLGTGRSPSLRL